MADSDSLSAGDHVVAIGSPLGLENSVSDGIISGFREKVEVGSKLLLQLSTGKSARPLSSAFVHQAPLRPLIHSNFLGR